MPNSIWQSQHIAFLGSNVFFVQNYFYDEASHCQTQSGIWFFVGHQLLNIFENLILVTTFS